MYTIPVTVLYNKTGQEPVTCTHMLRVQDWCRAYPEYLDHKIFHTTSHLGMISRGWTMIEYEYDPNPNKEDLSR